MSAGRPPLSRTEAFGEWVADTVAALSDICSEHPCGPQRKRALTWRDSRADACQGVGDNYFTAENQAFMRACAVVGTNLRILH